MARGVSVGGRRWPRLLIAALPAGFLLVFFGWPMVSILSVGLTRDGGFDPTVLASPFTDSTLRAVLWFTIWQAVASTLLTLVVALPGAWVVARYSFPGRGLIQALAVVAFVMPTVVVATAFNALLPDGLDRGLAAIFAAHVYLNVAIVLRMVAATWSMLDPRQEEAAASLGANRWRTFWWVTRPALTPTVLAAASIVLLFTLTSFGVVLLLGDFGQATIEVEIQRRVLFLFDLPTAAALSILQIVLVLVALIVQTRLTRRIAIQQDLQLQPPPRPRDLTGRLIVGGFLVTFGAAFIAPVVAVVVRALQVGDGYGLGNFAALVRPSPNSSLFVPAAQAITNSLTFAVAATVLATVLGLLIAASLARRQASLLDSIWLLPLGVSAVTLGFGMLITFDEPPLAWRGSVVLVPIAQALVALPFVVRAVLPVLRSVQSQLRDAAATLGASPARTAWAVDLPIVSRALLVAAGFAFAISLGEFGATLFVAPGDHPTVPIAIYRLLANPGAANAAQAMAMASILIALTAAAVLATDRFRVGKRTSLGARDV